MMSRLLELQTRQLKQLRPYLARTVIPFSKYYGSLFTRYSINPNMLRIPSDMERVPFTSKGDLLPEPGLPAKTRDFVLIPDQAVLKRRLSTVMRVIVRGPSRVKRQFEEEFRPVFMTSTTGRSSEPVPFLYTKYDLDNLMRAGLGIMEVGGSRPEWRHLNMFPYAPHLAFWLAHYASLAFDTFMLSTGGGRVMGTEGNVRLLEKIDPDILIAMPTFAYHLLQVAIDSGVRIKNLKRIVLGGEKVPTGMRRKLANLSQKLGASDITVIATYGFTEMKLAFPECPVPLGEEASGYHLDPELVYVEIIDPETGKLVGEGDPGEIVFTPLHARGSVVLRYRTGDNISGGLVYGKCPYCGREVPRLMGTISRVSDVKRLSFDKIKGTLVNLSDLEHLLDDLPNVKGWQIELRKRHGDPLDLDEIIVHLESVPEDQRSDLCEKIEQKFLDCAELKPNGIEFHGASNLRDMLGMGRELKEAKIVDRRMSSL